MAWTYNVSTFDREGNIYISEDQTVVIPANWGTYEVRVFMIRTGTATITLDFTFNVGSPVGYICTSRADYENTDGVPRSYIASFTPGRPVTIEIDDTEEYSVVVRAASSDSSSSGNSLCALTFEGGYTTKPYFTADISSSDPKAIYVEIFNYDTSYRDFEYYIDPDPNSVSPHASVSDNYTFDNLTEGTYTIRVFQIISGRRNLVYTQGKESHINITIQPDPWVLWPGTQYEDLGTISDLQSVDLSGLYKRTLYRYKMKFANTSYIEFTSSGNNDLIAYLSDSNQSTAWSTTTGTPNSYRTSDDNSGGNGNFRMVWRCTAGLTYYLWFKQVDGDPTTRQSIVTIDTTSGNLWQYDMDYTSQIDLDDVVTVPVNLRERVGAMFTFSCATSGTVNASAFNTNSYVYITTGDYGWNYSTGIPYRNRSGNQASGGRQISYTVSAHTTYYLWVRGISSEAYGSCDVTITPPVVTYSWEINNQTSDASVQNLSQNVSRKLISITKDASNHIAYTTKFAVSFLYSGTAVLYSTTIQSSDGLSLNAYIGTQDSNISSSDGVPTSYDYVSIGNYNFRLELTVTAGTTYYFWIKASNPKSTGSAYLNITVPTPPTPPVTGGKVWIYITSSGWTQAVPWVYTSSGWRQAVPWIYTTNGWKQTT